MRETDTTASGHMCVVLAVVFKGEALGDGCKQGQVPRPLPVLVFICYSPGLREPCKKNIKKQGRTVALSQ